MDQDAECDPRVARTAADGLHFTCSFSARHMAPGSDELREPGAFGDAIKYSDALACLKVPFDASAPGGARTEKGAKKWAYAFHGRPNCRARFTRRVLQQAGLLPPDDG